MPSLQEQFGPIDIYLFDQILRGRIKPGMVIVDAGFGSGRNLIYLLREGYEVLGVDADPYAVETVRKMGAQLAPKPLPTANFRAEMVERMSFPDACADVVISSAVLHFAHDDAQFMAMLHEMWRVLRPGGILFCRLASSIGLEQKVVPLTGRRCLLPDGSERFLVDQDLLLRLTETMGGHLLDPIKTTVVQDQRSMTTWVLRK